MISGENGIFTSLPRFLELIGFKRLSFEDKAFRQSARERDQFAELMGYPETWLTCPNCGCMSYRLPPHAHSACPLAEALGMKIEAERMTAIRMGLQMEEATRFIRDQMGDGDDDDGES